MLSEKQCKLIEMGLAEDVEPRKVAAYLCLNMGLTIAEAGALRRMDVDLSAGTLSINNVLSRPGVVDNRTPVELLTSDMVRVLPMPPHVICFLNKHIGLYGSNDCFIISGNTAIPTLYMMQNILSAICVKFSVADSLSATELRNAFIRRCIESGIDLYSLCWFIGIKQPNVIVKRFGEYLKPHPDSFYVLEKYGLDYMPPTMTLPVKTKHMNLLILGAGGQGHVVKETAEDIDIFDKIAFLDDNTSIEGVIDTIENYKKYVETYPVAFVAIGNNKLRNVLIERLEDAGYIVPVLRHPSATISPTVEAGAGTIFEAKVIVNAAVKIGKGVILASACVIDHGAVIGDYVHVDVGAMVKKDSVIPTLIKVSSGSIFDSESKQ